MWMDLRRVGSTVSWAAPIERRRTGIPRSWRFDLVGYLDALDAGAAAVARWAGNARRLADELTAQRDRPLGRRLGNAQHFYQLLDARVSATRPGVVSMTVAGPVGVVDFEVDATGRDTASLLDEIYDFDPQRYRRSGHST